MKLESQVTSLEVSKKLDSLGFKAESFWYHVKGNNVLEQFAFNPLKDFRTNQKLWINEVGNKLEGVSYWVPAYSVAELDQILMKTEYAVIVLHDSHWVFKRKKDTTLEYGMIGGHGMGPEKNGADKRGNLIAYLLENKLLPQGKLK